MFLLDSVAGKLLCGSGSGMYAWKIYCGGNYSLGLVGFLLFIFFPVCVFVSELV
jgi:hypothetical protein